jgi:A/G-specific adenine glycosylase
MQDFPSLSAQEATSYLWSPFQTNKHSLALFRTQILDFYQHHGRLFIWRESVDPYHILVSEVMLQQTQTSRAAPKYHQFLSQWPTLKALASASVLEVLTLWKGLGYNRRALYLLESAKLTERWDYQLPADEKLLLTLPGVGKATAAALMAFAFNRRSVYLETNIRRVIIHCFFADQDGVHDRQIEEVLNLLADEIEDYKRWYYALMDYGVLLKSLLPNPNRRSAHYTKQAAFENSNRQIRGLLIHLLSEEGATETSVIYNRLPTFPAERIDYCLSALKGEGFVEESGGVYQIKSS